MQGARVRRSVSHCIRRSSVVHGPPRHRGPSLTRRVCFLTPPSLHLAARWVELSSPHPSGSRTFAATRIQTDQSSARLGLRPHHRSHASQAQPSSTAVAPLLPALTAASPLQLASAPCHRTLKAVLWHEPRRCAPLPHGKSPDLPGSHPVEVAHRSLLLRSCALPLALCAFGTASALNLSNEIGVGGTTCGFPAWCSGFGVPTPPPVQWSASPSEFKAAAGSGTHLEIAWRRVKHTPGRVSPLRSQSAGSSGRRARARKPRSYV